MIEWLVPVSVFWTLAALYLGGFPLRIEGGTAGRELGGLLLTFVLYLGAWWVLRLVVGAALSPIFTVVVATLIAGLLLPLISRLAFRVLGVRIHTASHAHG